MVTQLEVHGPSDWPGLSGAIVLDPMVVRSAHVFVRGAAGLAHETMLHAQLALRENVSSLRDFIDLLVLQDGLHVFDYAATYPEGILGYPIELWETSDALDLGLVSVQVDPDAYQPAKAKAIAELQQVLDLRASLARPGQNLAELVASISGELQTFEYQWTPDLSALRVPPDVSLDATALRFAFGERLFNEYARQVGGVHVLQSKRLALAEHLLLGAAGRDVLARPEMLQRIAAEVNKRRPPTEQLATTDVLPSFVGYLLSTAPTTPRELLGRAVGIRHERCVVRHRKNLSELRKSVATGSFPSEVVADLAASARGVRRWLRDEFAAVTPVRRTSFLACQAAGLTTAFITSGGIAAAVTAAFGGAAGMATVCSQFLLGDAREQGARTESYWVTFGVSKIDGTKMRRCCCYGRDCLTICGFR